MAIKNPDLVPLFDELKAVLAPYDGQFIVREPEDGAFELWLKNDVSLGGRKAKPLYFAGLIIQKSFVGFYYMPLYTDPDVASRLEPQLLATLKGKTCFRIKTLTPDLAEQIRSAIRIGMDLYESNGWM